jgi:hypothetical protein
VFALVTLTLRKPRTRSLLLHHKVLRPRMMHHNRRSALFRLQQVGRG